MKRGEIYWVDIPARSPEGREISKRRPCVILSVTILNKARSTVVVVPLTSNGRTAPPIALGVASVGPMSVAVCDQIFAVDKNRVRDRQGQLSAPDLARLDECVREILGL